MNMWFGPPERNTLYPWKRVVLLCLLRCSRMSWSWFLLSFVWHFIPQGRTVTLWHGARQVAPGWLDPYIVGHSRLEVVNDVFNDMGTSGLVVLPGEWSVVLVLHYNHTVAAYPHVLQVVTVVPAHTSGSPIMALASGALETCTPALGTGEPCCTGRSARLFFHTWGPWLTRNCRTRGCSEPSPRRGWIWSHVMRGVPEPCYTWQPRSPPQLGGRFWCCGTRGGVWWHTLLFVLSWSLYAGVSGLQGTDIT
jgi:hypothetical protein